MFYHYKTEDKVKDKEHLKLRCLVQVGPGPLRSTVSHYTIN